MLQYFHWMPIEISFTVKTWTDSDPNINLFRSESVLNPKISQIDDLERDSEEVPLLVLKSSL